MVIFFCAKPPRMLSCAGIFHREEESTLHSFPISVPGACELLYSKAQDTFALPRSSKHVTPGSILFWEQGSDGGTGIH